MAHEVKRNGKYTAQDWAACDFLITGLASDEVVEWVLRARLPFDSLYFYGAERPIHISYGPSTSEISGHSRVLGNPLKKGLNSGLNLPSKFEGSSTAWA